MCAHARNNYKEGYLYYFLKAYNILKPCLCMLDFLLIIVTFHFLFLHVKSDSWKEEWVSFNLGPRSLAMTAFDLSHWVHLYHKSVMSTYMNYYRKTQGLMLTTHTVQPSTRSQGGHATSSIKSFWDFCLPQIGLNSKAGYVVILW